MTAIIGYLNARPDLAITIGMQFSFFFGLGLGAYLCRGRAR